MYPCIPANAPNMTLKTHYMQPSFMYLFDIRRTCPTNPDRPYLLGKLIRTTIQLIIDQRERFPSDEGLKFDAEQQSEDKRRGTLAIFQKKKSHLGRCDLTLSGHLFTGCVPTFT